MRFSLMFAYVVCFCFIYHSHNTVVTATTFAYVQDPREHETSKWTLCTKSNCYTPQQTVKSLELGLNSSRLVSFMFSAEIYGFVFRLSSHLTFVSSVMASSVFLLMQNNQYWCYLYCVNRKDLTTGVEFCFVLQTVDMRNLIFSEP